MTRGRCWLAVVWTNWCSTCGMFAANGMVTRGPINGRHVSPGQWYTTLVVDRDRPHDLRGKGKSFGKGHAQLAHPPLVLNIYMLKKLFELQ
jgi:hypothetical protein